MLRIDRIAEMEERQQERDSLKVVERDTSEIEKLRSKRRISRFKDFPWPTAKRYMDIAGAYPGKQVYACGSRVRGDYIDIFIKDAFKIRLARVNAGMADKKESDFDFWVEPNSVPVGIVSRRADRCRLRIPENEKIPLPMWDFSKLPESEFESVKSLLAANDIQALVKIHDRYQLSEYSYCCSGIEGVRNWFQWAVNQGIIK